MWLKILSQGRHRHAQESFSPSLFPSNLWEVKLLSFPGLSTLWVTLMLRLGLSLIFLNQVICGFRFCKLTESFQPIISVGFNQLDEGGPAQLPQGRRGPAGTTPSTRRRPTAQPRGPARAGNSPALPTPALARSAKLSSYFTGDIWHRRQQKLRIFQKCHLRAGGLKTRGQIPASLTSPISNVTKASNLVSSVRK